MSSVVSRRVLGAASRSIARSSASSSIRQLQPTPLASALPLRTSSRPIRLSRGPSISFTRQLQSQSFDSGRSSGGYEQVPGVDKPIYINLEKPPSIPRRIWRALYRTFGAILVVTFGSVIALVIYEPNMVITTDEMRMHILPTEGVSDEKTLEIEHYIQNHPYVQKLRQDPELVETRPHLDIPALIRPNVLTSGVLSGPDRIVVPPLVFSDKAGTRLYAIQYIGDHLCGHPGIVHGGLLATLLDETLARCCFPALPKKVGMTANLEVNYRAPSRAGRYYVIKAKTTKVEGRKAWVEGRLEELPAPDVEGDGKLCVEATALMIEPKNVGPLMREVVPSKILDQPIAPISSA